MLYLIKLDLLVQCGAPFCLQTLCLGLAQRANTTGV